MLKGVTTLAAILGLGILPFQDAGQGASLQSGVLSNLLGGQSGEPQSLIDLPASFKVEGVALEEALLRLQDSSGAPVGFSPSRMPGEGDFRVTCECQDLTVGEALNVILEGTSFDYVEASGRILVERDREFGGYLDAADDASQQEPHSVTRSALASVRRGHSMTRRPLGQVRQTGTVTGEVVDEAGRATAGATVRVVEHDLSTLTDGTGEFTFEEVPAGEATVAVEMIGYRPAEETVGVVSGETVEVRITLAEEPIGLDQVIVTGAGQEARRRETGVTVSGLRTDDIAEPVQNVDNLLQGRVPGMTVMESSGTVGDGGQIRLRGNMSVSMSNQPIIYIDGVRVRSENYPRNASPVARQDRGPNATGSPINDINPDDIERIEVVKGASAATLYGSEAAAGVIQIFTKSGHSGDTQMSAEIRQGARWVRPFGVEGEPTEFGARPEYLFIDPWLRTGHTQRYSLSARGGFGEVGTFFISGSLQDDQGVYPKDYERGGNIRGNLSAQVHDDFQVDWNTSYRRAHLEQTPSANNSHGINLNAYRRERNFVGTEDPEVISQVIDPYDVDTWIDRFTTGVTGTHTPSDRFSHRYSFGWDYAMNELRNVRPFGYIFAPEGIISNNRWSATTMTHDYRAHFDVWERGDWESTITWGGEYVEERELAVGGHGERLPGPGEHTVSSASEQRTGEERMRVITGGGFLQNRVGFRDRYFLTAALRVDGNSAFGDDFGLQAYPKIEGSYVISDEPFWRDGWGTLRIRGGYGHAGRAPGAFDAVRTWDPIGFREQPAFRPLNVGNPELGPERTREIDVGFEGAVLDDRLSFEVNLYRQRTTDALLSVRQIPSQGFLTSQLENVGELENRGIEVDLAGTVFRGASVRIEVGSSLAVNESEVLDLGAAPPFAVGNHGWIDEGGQVPAIRSDRIMNPDEVAEPEIDEDHMWGPNQPKYIAQPFVTVQLPRGAIVSVRGEYQGGHYMYDGPSLNALRRDVEWPTCFDAFELMDDGRTDELTAWERQACITENVRSDWFIEPADFFKLREISASVPAGFLVPGVEEATFTLSGRNLWRWQKMPLFDPEMNATSSMEAFTRRLTEDIPPPASVTASLRVQF